MPYTRPTTDRAKEGLFNVLGNMIDFEGLHALDLFGGTGCISYELCSRGAGQVVVIEKDQRMHDFIQRTSAALGISVMNVLRTDVFRYLQGCRERFDFVFAGPPYALASIDELPDAVIGPGLLGTGGVFVLEHTPRNAYAGHPHFHSERRYGTTVFSFFTAEPRPHQ